MCNEWLEIASAPKDGTRVLLWERYNDVPIVGYYHERLGKWYADQTNYDTDGNACVIDKLVQELISHWQPITAPGLAPHQPQPEGEPWDMKTAHEKAPELIAQLDEESERLTRYGGSGDALLNEAARVIEALTQPQPEPQEAAEPAACTTIADCTTPKLCLSVGTCKGYYVMPASVRESASKEAGKAVPVADEREALNTAAMALENIARNAGMHGGMLEHHLNIRCYADAHARDARAALASQPEPTSKGAKLLAAINEGRAFADGDTEAAYIQQSRDLNCPVCGGSGHVDDAASQQQALSEGEIEQLRMNSARWLWVVKQHEIDDEQLSNNNYGKNYPPRTLTVFVDDGEDGLEALRCDPGALSEYVDAAILAAAGGSEQ